MQKISAIIITFNEEKNIARCLQSLQGVADEIIVVDSGSTDKTEEICKSFEVKFIYQKWLGYGAQKRFAVAKATHDWIFSIDADEESSDLLRTQMREILNTANTYVGYGIKRRTFFLGKLIRYCGWQNDYPLRLFRKTAGNFNDKKIHEFVEIEGSIGAIKACIFHYSFDSMYAFFEKTNRYTELSAKEMVAKGRKGSMLGAVFKGVFKFFKVFIFQLGFLDGITGFTLSINAAFGVYLKHLKVYELSKTPL
jgi:glycosyltransferase involved in cell wall biosynthesis